MKPKAAKICKANRLDHRAERAKRGLNQTQYWSAIGITQPCGSRYENGQPIPLVVEAAAWMAYHHNAVVPEFK